MVLSTCEAAIIGAGPYGLAAAAHLRAANVKTHVFGQTMTFWEQQMPRGMFLRSSWEASHISSPQAALTLDAYQAAHGINLPTPIPLASFIEYGHWFQRSVVPDLDHRKVTRIETATAGFRLALEDGEVWQARRVVIAAGLFPFAYRPAPFHGLASSLVSHSSDHADLGRFAGRQVIVVGGGQSAIECAALLHEGGAQVEVVMRRPRIRWLGRSAWLHNQPAPIRRLLYPPTDVGPPGLNWIVALPDLFRLLPRAVQQRIAIRAIRPAASGWLQPRVGGVRITTGRHVLSAIPAGDRLSLALDDGTERHIDHVVLATGFRVDVARYPFLAPELVQAVCRAGGYPRLAPGFEASVAGLHFLGAPAAWSFGPVMRFVSGSEYAARALTRCILAGPPIDQHGVGESWEAEARSRGGDPIPK